MRYALTIPEEDAVEPHQKAELRHQPPEREHGMSDKPWGPAEWRNNADELEAISNHLEGAAGILAKYQEPLHGLLTRIQSLRNSARLDREYADKLSHHSSEREPLPREFIGYEDRHL